MKPRGRLVCVEWEDAQEHSTEADLDDDTPLVLAKSVGWARRGKDCVLVVATQYQCENSRDDGPVTAIPAAWIKRVTGLLDGKPVGISRLPRR